LEHGGKVGRLRAKVKNIFQIKKMPFPPNITQPPIDNREQKESSVILWNGAMG
jgi:hypothetical protein